MEKRINEQDRIPLFVFIQIYNEHFPVQRIQIYIQDTYRTHQAEKTLSKIFAYKTKY